MNQQPEINTIISKSINIKKLIMWAITIIVPLIILAIPTTESFTPDIRLFFALTLSVILMWAFELLPFLIPSLILPVMYILFNIAPAAKVFLPWSHYIPWMIVGGMILTKIFEDNGLLKRISYWCIIKAGGSYRALIYGLMMSGILMAIILPDIASRVILYSALAYGICKALELEPKSKSSAGIMMAGVLAALTPAYMFSISAAQTLIVNNIAAQYDINVTFMGYLLKHGLPTLVWCFITAGLIDFLFKPGKDDNTNYKEYFQEERKKMGKMTAKEIKLSIISLAICIGVLTESIHGISVGWVFLIAAFICYLPGINLGKEDDLNVNYPLVIFVAACMTIGVVSNIIGAGKFVATILYPFISGGQLHVISAGWLLAVILNFVMTPLAAVSSVTGPLVDIAVNSGVAVKPVLYAWNQGLEQIILPYEYALVLFAFGYGYISLKDLIKTFGFRMLLNIVFLWVICVPFWKLIGLF
ncbi:MAG: SLC13 family permease [Clostridiales bacterium]|nr:SLC13 family permease [Clostridiales bacterium]MCF8021095.1 SLC13 family permease [Clostridiales bacterium]